MSNESIEDAGNAQTNQRLTKKQYLEPTLTDYGKMSDLTKTLPSGSPLGTDGGAVPSSYLLS